MAQNTPIAGLPWPELTDIPNAQTAFQNLANALDTQTIPKFASTTARGAAIPTPVDGQHVYRTDLHAPQFYHAGMAAWAFAGAVPLTRTVLGATTATVTFSSIPQDFNHLLLIYEARSDIANYFVDLSVRFNGDTGSNYSTQGLYANGAGGTAQAAANVALNGAIWSAVASGAQAGANEKGSGFILIPNYSSTTRAKNFQGLSSLTSFSTNQVFSGTRNGAWNSTAAITSITIFPPSANFVASSIFELYGMS